MQKLAILLVFLALLAGETYSQKKHEDFKIQIATFKKKKKYKVRYDKFEDRSIVSAGRYVVKTSRGAVVLHAVFSFEKTVLKTRPKNIGFVIIAQGVTFFGTTWRFLKTSKMILLIDGKPFPIGQAKEKDSSVGRSVLGATTKEIMYYSIPIDLFEDLSTAKSVEFRIGKEEGKFNKTVRRLLRSLPLAASYLRQVSGDSEGHSATPCVSRWDLFRSLSYPPVNQTGQKAIPTYLVQTPPKRWLIAYQDFP